MQNKQPLPQSIAMPAAQSSGMTPGAASGASYMGINPAQMQQADAANVTGSPNASVGGLYGPPKGAPGPAAPPGPIDPSMLGAFGQPGQGPGAAAPPMPKPQMVAASNQSLVDPRLAAQQKSAFTDQQRAIADQQNAAQLTGKAEALGMQAQAAQEQVGAKQIEANAGDYKSERMSIGDQAEQMRQRREDARARLEADHIDSPDEVWSKTDSLDKVRYTLARGIGGALMGINHMDHNPFDRVQEHINGEIASQKAKYEKDKNSYEARNSAYGQLVQQMGSPAEAAKVLESHLLNQTAAEAKAMALNTGSATALGKGQELAAQLRERSTQVGENAVATDIAQHKYVAAHMAGGLTPQQQVDWKAQHQISKEREAAGIPSFESNEKFVQGLVAKNGGELPGTGLASRAAHALGAESIRGTDARQLDGALTSMAEAMAHANGQRGTEAIEMNKKILMGNGSADDIQAGLARAHGMIQARAKEIAAGAPALQNQLHGMNRAIADDEPGGAAEQQTPDGFDE